MTILIEKTAIGTPLSINGLSLCKGVALIPPIPDIPAGFQTGTSRQLKGDHKFSKFHAVRASAAFAVGVHAGLCGPGYALSLTAEGELDEVHQVLTLTIEDDEAMAGIFLGAGMSVEITLGCEFYKVYTHHHVPHWGWRTGPGIELSASVDAFKAAVDLIAAVLNVEDLIPKVCAEQATDLAGTPLAMIGESSDQYAARNGVLQLDCIFSLPINLWAVIVVAAAATLEIPWLDIASAAVIAIHEALDVTLSSIGFGPTIGVDVPVLLQIADVAVDGVRFDRTDVQGNQWIGQKAAGQESVSTDPKELAFNMAHNCGVDFTVGLYVEVQLVELFHAGVSGDIGIMALFDKEPFHGGVVHHTLKNDIGETVLTAACACEALPSDRGWIDVEFL